jgi:hypothetical protein
MSVLLQRMPVNGPTGSILTSGSDLFPFFLDVPIRLFRPGTHFLPQAIGHSLT